MSPKSLLKHLYYRLSRNPELQGYELTLAFIVHTESLHDGAAFKRLETFCARYRALTGARPICAAVSGANRLSNGSEAVAERCKRLESVAALGLHGHFWENSKPMNAANFSPSAVSAQLDSELAWFAKNGLERPRAYAAGWWFLNDEILNLLAAHKFEVDYSFSHSPWFSSPFAERKLAEFELETGRPFLAPTASGELLCIQNLVGCPTENFPRDFDRNLKPLLSPEQTQVLGVINAHDFDLEPDAAIACVEHLQKTYGARFLAHDELVREARRRLVTHSSADTLSAGTRR